jgi:hypothetical protein
VVAVLLGGAAIVAALVLGINLALGVVGSAIADNAPRVAASPAPACPAADPVTVGGIVVPRGPVAGYCQDRLVNAAEIMSAARSLGIGPHTQAVGVMTAIGESGLRNLDYGDAAGPDSRGLFQQRDNGSWGTLAERMDPYTAALHFFQKAIRVPGWQTMPANDLAHAVQGNADPGYYAQFWPAAQQIVEALGGQSVP